MTPTLIAFISFPRPEYVLASAVMLLWPVICLLIFTWLPRHRAAILCYLVGVLCLPAANGLVIPGLPHFTRKTLPAVGVLVAAMLINRWPWKGARLDGVSKGLLALIMLSNIPRVWANVDPMIFPNTVVPGLTPPWLVTFIVEDTLTLVVPLLIGLGVGRQISHTQDMLRIWLKVGLLYMVLAAIEVRMSPQVHVWVYGYFQHSFAQMVRYGGYRPIVFMEHALELALFTATCLLFALIGSKTRVRVWGIPAGFTLWLFVPMLIASKSFGAMLYGAAGLLFLYVASPNVRSSVAKWTAVVVLTLPITRLLDWIPTDSLVEFASDIDAERASSLWFRLNNEDRMLDKVAERAWTGWGGFDRIQAYDQWGAKLSILDGSWVIELLSGGIPRFFGVFGLLAWPIFKAARLTRRLPRGRHKQLLASMALVASFLVLDLVPNSFFNYFSALVCGVLLGLCQSTAETLPARRAVPRSDELVIAARRDVSPPR